MPPGKIHPPKRPIQSFVPVRLDDRTELFSHRELCALASSDPRNELDELSEPNRFQKNITKSGACSEPEGRHGRLSREWNISLQKGGNP